MEEERPTGMDAGEDDDLVPPPTEVPPEEAFLDVQECATLHEEGLDPLVDGVDANEVAGNAFGVVWEEEEAHVMVDSRAANVVMDRQQGYGSPSSYIPEPFRETEALQYFLRFFPYELLPDWTAEITRRGRSKSNRSGSLVASCTCHCTLAQQEGLLASDGWGEGPTGGPVQSEQVPL
eukprot:scaffold1143_cov396-Pavlova_lutheri.AAC.2